MMKEKHLPSEQQAGLRKPSFELNYRGGTIWCEHLDSMGGMEEAVIRKFEEDGRTFRRPSVSAYMIVNLDETVVTERIVSCVARGILECPKRFVRVAFVGVGRKEQRQLEALLKDSGARICFLKDYEKAKEWVL